MVNPQTIVGLIVTLAMMVAIIPAVGTTAAGPPLYPDLRTPSPANLYFENGWDGVWRLRFSNTVSNYGGRLEITVDANKRIYQNVYDSLSGGSLVSSTRVGSDLIFHPTHNHFHFADFARYELLVQDKRGAYRRSPRQSQKTTFCIIDFQKVNSPGPSSPQYTSCGENFQGLSAGWGDTYYADLPDQWIVLGSSRLADGNYALRSTADPYNKLRETDETNNEGVTYFRVQNGQIVATGAPALCRSTPDSAPVGTVVTLSCTGFGNNEPVDIRWGGPSTNPLQTETSGPTGTVQAQVTIPEGGSGNHYIIATGRTSNTEIAAIFNTEPSAFRQHWNRVVGSKTMITLKGYSPGENVRLVFNVSPGSNVVLGTTTVDSLGRGSMQITIPTSRLGRHDVIATGLSSGLSATAPINVNPSMQVVPAEVSAGGQVGISLRGYGGPENVTVTVNNANAGTIRTSSTGSTTASSSKITVPESLAAGTYTLTATGQSTGASVSASINVTGIDLAAEPTQPPATPEPDPATPGPDDVETPTSDASPIAHAGIDQDVTDDDNDGFADVWLDGSGSYDPEGGEPSVSWTLPDDDDEDLDPQEIGTKLVEKVSLPVGVSIVTLTVTDAAGNTATDEVKVTVLPAPAPDSADGTPTSD
ncbi:MAG: hypothetical protein IT334_12515 [Thermomicrobiales bacterium]|nr:hypothetical protein [Thermomicrobiales bacterium]